MADEAGQLSVHHVEARAAVCHGRRMAKRTPVAGGFFWMTAILIGAVGGIAGGNTMKGVLVGTAAGAVIALALWLLDRARR
jgi:hypothetical protein